jgi:hypothetical protein
MGSAPAARSPMASRRQRHASRWGGGYPGSGSGFRSGRSPGSAGTSSSSPPRLSGRGRPCGGDDPRSRLQRSGTSLSNGKSGSRPPKGTAEQQAAARAAEKRRRRYPVADETLPPSERVVMTHQGIVAFTDITGELIEEPSPNASTRASPRQVLRLCGQLGEANPRRACQSLASPRVGRHACPGTRMVAAYHRRIADRTTQRRFQRTGAGDTARDRNGRMVPVLSSTERPSLYATWLLWRPYGGSIGARGSTRAADGHGTQCAFGRPIHLSARGSKGMDMPSSEIQLQRKA